MVLKYNSTCEFRMNRFCCVATIQTIENAPEFSRSLMVKICSSTEWYVENCQWQFADLTNQTSTSEKRALRFNSTWITRNSIDNDVYHARKYLILFLLIKFNFYELNFFFTKNDLNKKRWMILGSVPFIHFKDKFNSDIAASVACSITAISYDLNVNANEFNCFWQRIGSNERCRKYFIIMIDGKFSVHRQTMVIE